MANEFTPIETQEAFDAAIKARIREMGPINVAAVDEYRQTLSRVEELSAQRDDLNAAIADLEKIPIRQETIEVCEFYDINPYMLISSGCMLIGTPHGNKLVDQLAEKKIPAAVIGRATTGNDRIIRSGQETRFLEPAGSDELYKIYQ